MENQGVKPERADGYMTVGSLIEALQKYPAGTRVMIIDMGEADVDNPDMESRLDGPVSAEAFALAETIDSDGELRIGIGCMMVDAVFMAAVALQTAQIVKEMGGN